MKNLTTAIFAKCAVGTDLYNDVAGRLFNGRAPEGAEYPYIVFLLVSDVPDLTFSENYEDVIIQFSLFSSTIYDTTEVENMFTHLKALYDECVLSPTSETVIYMMRQNATLMSEDHTTLQGTVQIWAYHIDYDLKVKV